MGRLAHRAGLVIGLLAAVGCRQEEEYVGPNLAAASASATAPQPPPVDRLAPGELAPGKADAFGLVLPRKLKVDATFPRAVHASGRVSPEALSNYIRERVLVSHVELGAARTVFPRVRIKGGAPNRTYRIEVVGSFGGSKLVVRDVTRPAAPRGISIEERWRRAGMTPKGKPLDLDKLQ
jgi:hypothetical protein